MKINSKHPKCVESSLTDKMKVKGKFTLEEALKLYPFFYLNYRWVGCQRQAPAALLARK
jgi:hypothetical protein